MPKEDYLIKFLEKLRRIITAMLSLRQKGQPDESIGLADEVFKELFTLDTNMLARMPQEDYIELIKKQNYSSIYLETLAGLSYETGKSFSDMGETLKAGSFYQKSLQVYYLLNEKDKTFSFEREERISELEKM